MTRALRDLAIAHGERPKRTRGVRKHKPRRRRPYQWRPMSAPPPAWAERKRRTYAFCHSADGAGACHRAARFARTRWMRAE